MSYLRGFSMRTQRIRAAMTGIALLAGYLGACAAQQERVTHGEQELSYKCDTAGVQLEGVLIERMSYGPPGFGETPAKDLKDKVLVLRLARPITVEPLQDAEAKNSTSLNTIQHVSQVQLFFPGTQAAEARKLLGKKVVAVGTLNEAVAPRQYTDVTMDVKTVGLK